MPPGLDRAYIFYIIDMLKSKSIKVPVVYMLSDFIFSLMFLRVYFLIRTLLNFSLYSDLYATRLAARYNVNTSTGFYIKALYCKKPGMMVMMVSTISIIWLSYVLRIFER